MKTGISVRNIARLRPKTLFFLKPGPCREKPERMSCSSTSAESQKPEHSTAGPRRALADISEMAGYRLNLKFFSEDEGEALVPEGRVTPNLYPSKRHSSSVHPLMHAWQLAATRRTHQQEPPGNTSGTWLQTPSATNQKFIWRLKEIAQEAAQTRCPAASTQKLCCQPGLYLLRVKRLLLPRPHPARPRGARRVSQPRQARLGCREGFGMFLWLEFSVSGIYDIRLGVAFRIALGLWLHSNSHSDKPSASTVLLNCTFS